MTTLTDAMVDATAELHAAALEMRTARETFVATSRGNIEATSALVATVTPLSRTWFVDPVNGNDQLDGTTAAKAKKSLESVLFIAPPNTRHNVALLGDTVVTLVAPLAATMSIFGAQPAAGPVGYSDARRRLDFRPEATNSPSTDGTRRSGGMYMSAQLALRNLDLIIPDAPAGVLGACFVGANCSAITATSCTINGTTASNSARLLAGSDASALQFWFSGTIGPGATGRIFTGITPGQDPNLSKTYITNLTAA